MNRPLQGSTDNIGYPANADGLLLAKVLKAFDDPVAAAKIFVRDQKVMLDRFATNIDRAQTRLGPTENVVAESVNLMTRAYELHSGKNDTLTALIVLPFPLRLARYEKA